MMKNFLLLFIIFPFWIFSQSTNIIGDVDCDGLVNSEDASLILQYVTSVIDTLPCYQNLNGLTPDQLEEMINLISEEIIVDSEPAINSLGPAYDLSLYPDFTPFFPQNSNYFLYYFDAIRFCSELEHDGYSDWYLPTASQIQKFLKNNTSNANIENTNNVDGYNFWLYLDEFSIGDIGGAGVMIIYYQNQNFRNFYYTTLNDINRCFCVR